jgi:hypothetical protein
MQLTKFFVCCLLILRSCHYSSSSPITSVFYTIYNWFLLIANFRPHTSQPATWTTRFGLFNTWMTHVVQTPITDRDNWVQFSSVSYKELERIHTNCYIPQQILPPKLCTCEHLSRRVQLSIDTQHTFTRPHIRQLTTRCLRCAIYFSWQQSVILLTSIVRHMEQSCPGWIKGTPPPDIYWRN